MRKLGPEMHDFGGTFTLDHNNVKHYLGEGALEAMRRSSWFRFIALPMAQTEISNQIEELDKQIEEAKKIKSNKDQLKELEEKRLKAVKKLRNSFT